MLAFNEDIMQLFSLVNISHLSQHHQLHFYPLISLHRNKLSIKQVKEGINKAANYDCHYVNTCSLFESIIDMDQN
jgi:hypothetical protein